MSIRSATTSSSSPSSRSSEGGGEDSDLLAIERLPGAGPVTVERLRGREIRSIRDLLFFFPRAYEDYRRMCALSELAEVPAGAHVVVRGRVVRVHKFFRRLLDVTLEESGARLRARWFRPPAGMAKAYVRGASVAFAGKLRKASDGLFELVHPRNVTALLDQHGSVGIRPRYSLVEKVPGRTVEKLVSAALAVAGSNLADPLPQDLRDRLGLPGLSEALGLVHQPPLSLSQAELAALTAGTSPAQRRFAFEELLVLQLALRIERGRVRKAQAWSCPDESSRVLAMVRMASELSPTSAQARAIASITRAMAEPAPMQCLLQGDVGSGKTLVVFAACLAAVSGSGQSVLLAPTAVLAEQHRDTLVRWGERVGLRVGLLHSGLGSAEQHRVVEAAAAGKLDVIVGTHALLEDRLRLPRLALAVVDEQHRFGVRQRARLRRLDNPENHWQIGARAGMVPHLLVLSATPIPRTLALTVYGDLDLVTLDDMPPGRKPVKTHVCMGAEERDQAYAAVRETVARGGQAFVVCPAIHEVEEDSRKPVSVAALARELKTTLGHARIAVLHGQQKPEVQRQSVEKFRRGACNVLVATTVVEVGVDVPAASVMVVEDADRFGLAQLHQLRGRVGRGGQEAHCYLLTSSEDEEARARLRLLDAHHDGFRIAEEDLRRRGSGDLQGTRQAGTPELRFADLAAYADLVESARREAEALLARDPELAFSEHAELARAVAERLARERPVAEEAG